MAERHIKNKAHELSHSQWLILKAIYRSDKKLGVKDIADSLGITSSGVTQIVNTLDKKNYIKRESDPDDRRNIHLTLSKKAEKKIAGMMEKLIEDLVPLFDVFNDEELSIYYELNKKLADHILLSLNRPDAK